MKRIIIVGKGGSGKDYLRKIFESFGFIYCKSYTTRPMREGEENGKDYFFIGDKDIPKKEDLYESVYFNNWFYGTPRSEFEKSNLFIMTPKGIKSLIPKDRKESFIVYVDADESSRRSRLSQRKDSDTVERRLKADEEDFNGFVDFDSIMDNSIKDGKNPSPLTFLLDNLFSIKEILI